MSDKQSAGLVGRLSVAYDDKPIVRSLLSLVPGWSTADTLLQVRATQVRNERLHAFFDELATGERMLSEEVLQQDDFLYCFFRALRASVHTRRTQKASLFARILLHAAGGAGVFSSADDVEELLEILDSLTEREFVALGMLHEMEAKARSGASEKQLNELQLAQTFWDSFLEAASCRLAIPKEELPAFMKRLERTGLYSEFVGGYFDYQGGVGRTTSILTRLLAHLADLDQVTVSEP